jgi:hypothetical protein
MMATDDWPKAGDKVELIASEGVARHLIAGTAGTVSQVIDRTQCVVAFTGIGSLLIDTRLLRRPYAGSNDNPDKKIAPGSTVKCANIQNISIDVLGEGRTINVSAGQVVDWFDDKFSHTPTSETSRLMAVRLRQAIRRLVDIEKHLQCPGKDAPDREHLPYIATAARITNDVLAVIDDLNSSITETVF